MKDARHRVCSVKVAASLDNRIRRWLQDPHKILGPYIEEGMIVLDVGCGPGFFSIEMAKMVGKSGRVIAADLQEGMLEKLRKKIQGTELEERITLHKCEKNRLGVPDGIDFVLAFYMVHEIPDQEGFFNEVRTVLRPKGLVLVVEPPFHASRKEFEEMIRKARNAGLIAIERPKMFLNKAVVLQNG